MFSELLEKSLLSVNDTRAWVDEAQRYKWVRQSRVPLSCPQVLVVNCAGGCWGWGWLKVAWHMACRAAAI